ncbi:MAG TPA: cation acetate symporter [Chthonomonadaceae bacterium]|nr:cation acetate symporter [Chthonomonadaceae bacterium]
MIIPLLFVLLMIGATIGLGIYATRMAKSASDFFVAGRSVNVFWNASAISGEYLSAASFMGVAGLIMKNGYDALWYPVGYATGYLLLLLFIAGPLRRFGAYTIPDFAEGRFDSKIFRRIAVIFVLFIGFFYTMPQMKAAGITLGSIMNWPYYVGILVVGLVIVFNVALGGMKGITFVQAFQYWAKMFAICVPIFVLWSVYGGYGENLDKMASKPKEFPTMTQAQEVTFTPATAVSASVLAPTKILFPAGAEIGKISPARKSEPGEDPMPLEAVVQHSHEMTYSALGVPGKRVRAEALHLDPGTELTINPYVVTKQGQPVMKDGKPVKTAPKLEFLGDTQGMFAAGTVAPNAPNNQKWGEPFGPLTSKYEHPLLYTYSLILALVCGTAGLPHILVRFYTNPDGRSAKRTALWVMILIGMFYMFTPVWGTLGRQFLPSVYASITDLAVIKLPLSLENKTLGQILSGITSAGAFAAFMSTFSGLLVSMSGALAHDIYGKMIRPHATEKERLSAFKIAAIVFGAIAMGLGLLIQSFDIAMLVGWAFAIAAASYFPLLLLGSWWRGLTKHGAAVGMLTGGTLSLLAIVASMLIDKKILAWTVSPITKTLMEQPAIWGVPLALITMYIVSKLTAQHIPPDVDMKMLRLHAPEEMGISKDYIEH